MAIGHERTKEELYRRAKRLGIKGRSKMNRGPAQGCSLETRPLSPEHLAVTSRSLAGARPPGCVDPLPVVLHTGFSQPDGAPQPAGTGSRPAGVRPVAAQPRGPRTVKKVVPPTVS